MKTNTIMNAGLLVLALLTLPWYAGIAEEIAMEKACAVTYVNSSSIYMDAGKEDGLRLGDRVEVVSGGQVVAVLKVRAVASHKSSCIPVDGDTALFGLVRVGDRVRYYSHEVEVPNAASLEAGSQRAGLPAAEQLSALSTDAVPDPSSTATRPPSSFSGRVGIGYMTVIDQVSASGGFTRPAFNMRIDSTNMGGSPFSFHVDTRIRRTDSASGGESESRNGLYRFSVEWQDGDSPYHLSLGRQFSPALSGLSLLDGLLLERRTDRWAFGLFAGTQPDPQTYSFSSDTTEYGVFAQRTSLPQSESTWELTSGLVGMYGKGKDFREFFFLQTHYFTRLMTFAFNQEVDFNRSWKSDAGETSLALTNTFAVISIRATEALSFNVGYDNRQTVLLYREFINPETEFDDANRQGLWTGAEARLLDHFRIGVRYQGYGGGSSGSSTSYTVNLGAQNLFPFHLDLTSRSTRFENSLETGWLHTLAAYLPVGRRTQFGIYGGLREDESIIVLSDPAASSRLTWFGLDLNLRIGRSWLFLLSAERNVGDEEEYDQIYTTLNYRF